LHTEDFANPVLIGETRDPYIIVNKDDDTYARKTNLYNNHFNINGPFSYQYKIRKSRQIVSTWNHSANWQGYRDKVPARNWYAPLAEKVRLLDLSFISSASFPRMNADRSEPGVIYSKVPLLVYGNPSVPVAVICEKNIYLKSINGYFPATTAGKAVKSLGLNNVAIWTTKGLFSTMSFHPKMVLCGSVITMDSKFGKTYHKSYVNFGNSYVGIGGQRTSVSGFGAVDLAANNLNSKEGHMHFNRESYMYTKMFRGDDRTTAGVIEGPPPHFPVYFEKVSDRVSSLERALVYMEKVKPYVINNRKVPDSVLRQIKEEFRDE